MARKTRKKLKRTHAAPRRQPAQTPQASPTSEPSPTETPIPPLNEHVTSMILEQMPFRDLGGLRLMSRLWNRVITETVMRSSLPTLKIQFSCRGWRAKSDFHYAVNANDIEALRTILQRHRGVRTLQISSASKKAESEDFNFKDLIPELKNLVNLRQLDIDLYHVSESSVRALRHLPSLSALSFSRSNITGAHLHLLGDNIRSLKFTDCYYLEKRILLKVLRKFHSRQIPFEALELHNVPWNGFIDNSFSPTQFCLKKFPSLQTLVLDETNDFPERLGTIVATDLQRLQLWPDRFQHYRQLEIYTHFCERLFRNRFPNLRKLEILWEDEVAGLRRCLRGCSPDSLEALTVYIDRCKPIHFFGHMLRFGKLKELHIYSDDDRSDGYYYGPRFALSHVVAMVKHLPRLESSTLAVLCKPSPQMMKKCERELIRELSHQPEGRTWTFKSAFFGENSQGAIAHAMNKLQHFKVNRAAGSIRLTITK